MPPIVPAAAASGFGATAAAQLRVAGTRVVAVDLTDATTDSDLNASSVSGIIRAENSFCIVRVNANEPARHVQFEEVKAQIRKTLEAQRVDLLRGALNRRLRKTARVEELS